MLTKQGETLNGMSDKPAVKREIDEYRESDEFQRYEALCRGEEIMVSACYFFFFFFFFF